MKAKRREISLYAGRRFRRSESGRKSRPAPFEMTGGEVRGYNLGHFRVKKAILEEERIMCGTEEPKVTPAQ